MCEPTKKHTLLIVCTRGFPSFVFVGSNYKDIHTLRYCTKLLKFIKRTLVGILFWEHKNFTEVCRMIKMQHICARNSIENTTYVESVIIKSQKLYICITQNKQKRPACVSIKIFLKRKVILKKIKIRK